MRTAVPVMRAAIHRARLRLGELGGGDDEAGGARDEGRALGDGRGRDLQREGADGELKHREKVVD